MEMLFIPPLVLLISTDPMAVCDLLSVTVIVHETHASTISIRSRGILLLGPTLAVGGRRVVPLVVHGIIAASSARLSTVSDEEETAG